MNGTEQQTHTRVTDQLARRIEALEILVAQLITNQNYLVDAMRAATQPSPPDTDTPRILLG